MKAADSFANSTVEGIKRARSDRKYIHIGDGPVLKYAASRLPCNVVVVPGLTAERGLGFALNLNDPTTRNISLAMLRLRQIGFLSSLERKWFDSRSQCPNEASSVLKNQAIQLTSMVGVYIVLAAGTGLAFIALVFERYWYNVVKEKFVAYRNRKQNLEFELKSKEMSEWAASGQIEANATTDWHTEY